MYICFFGNINILAIFVGIRKGCVYTIVLQNPFGFCGTAATLRRHEAPKRLHATGVLQKQNAFAKPLPLATSVKKRK